MAAYIGAAAVGVALERAGYVDEAWKQVEPAWSENVEPHLREAAGVVTERLKEAAAALPESVKEPVGEFYAKLPAVSSFIPKAGELASAASAAAGRVTPTHAVAVVAAPRAVEGGSGKSLTVIAVVAVVGGAAYAFHRLGAKGVKALAGKAASSAAAKCRELGKQVREAAQGTPAEVVILTFDDACVVAGKVAKEVAESKEVQVLKDAARSVACHPQVVAVRDASSTAIVQANAAVAPLAAAVVACGAAAGATITAYSRRSAAIAKVVIASAVAQPIVHELAKALAAAMPASQGRVLQLEQTIADLKDTVESMKGQVGNGKPSSRATTDLSASDYTIVASPSSTPPLPE